VGKPVYKCTNTLKTKVILPDEVVEIGISAPEEVSFTPLVKGIWSASINGFVYEAGFEPAASAHKEE